MAEETKLNFIGKIGLHLDFDSTFVGKVIDITVFWMDLK